MTPDADTLARVAHAYREDALAVPSDRSALDALLAQARAEVAREMMDAARTTHRWLGARDASARVVVKDLTETADRIAPGWRDKEKG